MRTLLVLFVLLECADGLSQKIGQWTSYLPYQSGISVTQSESKVYYGTEWSVLQVDKDDFSVETISKTNGLSDISISALEYDIDHDQLIVAYINGNIDILKTDQTINLPNIKLNTDLTGSKAINDIYIQDNSIFLSTGFGLVEIDSESLLFGFTTFTGVAVNASTVVGDQLYISTDEGIYYANIDGSQNLVDFSQWQFLGSESGMSDLYQSKDLAGYGSALYYEADDILYRLIDGQAEEIWSTEGLSIGFVNSNDDYLMFSVDGSDGRGDVLYYNGTDFIKSASGCNDLVRDAIIDQNGRAWYADAWREFRTAPGITEPCNRINVNSPWSEQVSNISIKGGSIYVASGGVRDNYDYRFTREGVYFLADGDWNNLNEENTPFIKENELVNFLKIQPHPSSEEIFMGTYWGGLMSYDQSTQETKLYDASNSSLQGTVGDEQRERVTGIHLDEDENMWITTFGSKRALALKTAEGSWYNFDLGSNQNFIDIAQDEYGYLWLPVFGNNGGIYVYDPGESITSSSDDRVRFISMSNSELTTNIINTVKVDLDGAVWVGTAEGPVIFDCSDDPFDRENCPGDRIKVVQNGIVAFLLADQDVLTIEIDGANQKWLGTRNGLFVQSSDGEDEIFRFTENNSPLFDNRIRDMAYDASSGAMYIGTDKGLLSYQTPATGGAPFHSADNVLVYPNPVEPDYRGPIAIKGLRADVFVQITDVNGNLVTELRAQGGQAIWYGEDLNGNEVKSGVYLVFASDDNSFDLPDAVVAKVMVVR